MKSNQEKFTYSLTSLTNIIYTILAIRPFKKSNLKPGGDSNVDSLKFSLSSKKLIR